MSTFKKILSDILNNTKITIDKTGVNVKNGDLDITVPVPGVTQESTTNIPKLESPKNKYICRGIGVSGATDLFGGVYLVSIYSERGTIPIIATEDLHKVIPDMTNLVTTDIYGNRIQILQDEFCYMVIIEISCQSYNTFCYMKQSDYSIYENTAYSVIKYYWDRSLRNSMTYLVGEHCEIINDITEKLPSISNLPTGGLVFYDPDWSQMLEFLCDDAADVGRSNIGRNIAVCEGLPYQPEIPKSTNNLNFMDKYSHFFDNQENLQNSVKSIILDRLLREDNK